MANTALPSSTWVQIIGQPYLCLYLSTDICEPWASASGNVIATHAFYLQGTLAKSGDTVVCRGGIRQHTQLSPTVWECPAPNVNGAKMEKPSAKPSTWNALPFPFLPPSCPPCIIFFQALQKFPSPVKSSQPCSLLSYCFNFFV